MNFNDEELRQKYFSDCDITFRPTGKLTLQQLIKNSDSFRIPFPVQAIQSKNILKYFSSVCCSNTRSNLSRDLLENATTTYPIVHEDFFELAIDFLEHKKKYGSPPEKSLYHEMNLVTFITRLLHKKAACFHGSLDKWLLPNGKKGLGGWKTIGKENQAHPLLLKHCLSYDELKLSALITLSSPSFFINDGSTSNRGVPSPHGDSEENGVVIAIGSCQITKYGYLDFQDIVVEPRQNISAQGYGKAMIPTEKVEENLEDTKRILIQHDFLGVFAKYYRKTHMPIWRYVYEACQPDKKNNTDQSPDATNINTNVNESPEFYELINEISNNYFSKDVYRIKCRRTIEVVLMEANLRGIHKDKKVFLHFGGHGLGTYVCSAQELVFMEAFIDALNKLDLLHISDVFFDGWRKESLGKFCNHGDFGMNTIKLHFGTRSPQQKLVGKDDEHKLLVVCYPAEVNCLPGNKFWLQLADASPIATSTQIAELQNPHINPMLTGNNIRVASPTFDKIMTISEFFDLNLVVLETTVRQSKYSDKMISPMIHKKTNIIPPFYTVKEVKKIPSSRIPVRIRKSNVNDEELVNGYADCFEDLYEDPIAHITTISLEEAPGYCARCKQIIKQGKYYCRFCQLMIGRKFVSAPQKQQE